MLAARSCRSPAAVATPLHGLKRMSGRTPRATPSIIMSPETPHPPRTQIRLGARAHHPTHYPGEATMN
jgi:hypothetical protein